MVSTIVADQRHFGQPVGLPHRTGFDDAATLGPDGPADADLAHAVACLRASKGRHVENKSIQAALRSPTWGDLVSSTLDCDPDIRSSWPDQWLALRAGRHREQADSMRHVIELARGLIETEPDEPASTEAPAVPEGFRLKPLGALDFMAHPYRMEWAVNRVLVRDQPAVLAGPKKTLKTTILGDLCVSAVTGTPFLGHFPVERPTSVLMLSGESGGFVLQDTIRRVCQAKGIDPGSMEGRFFIDFQLPQLSSREHLDELARTIDDTGAEIVLIDPIYLCLVGGAAGRKIDPANLFDMGPLFQSVARACLQRGCTPVLVHHFKGSVADPYALPEMDNMAFAGIKEFARQWILLGRRERYEPGSGKHALWLSVGGSAGHSGEWAVDADEGQMADDFTGRRWEVEVRSAGEARTEAVGDRKAEAEAKAAERQTLAEATAEQRLAADIRRVLDAIRELNVRCEPATASRIKAQALLNGERAAAALARAATDNRVFRTTVPRPEGTTKGPKLVEVYTLAIPPEGGSDA